MEGAAVSRRGARGRSGEGAWVTPSEHATGSPRALRAEHSRDELWRPSRGRNSKSRENPDALGAVVGALGRPRRAGWGRGRYRKYFS